MSGLLYIVARVGFGAVLTARAWRDGESSRAVLAQLGAEACALLFLLGFSQPQVRTAVGGLWIPIFLYAVCWEAVRVRHWYWEAVEAPSADDATAAETLMAPLAWLWELLGVLPPMMAGAYLFWTVATASR
jgi:hypothetical protein